MRCLLAVTLIAVVLGQCQPACQSPEVCDTSVAPAKCVSSTSTDPCRQTQCAQFQVCRVENDPTTGAPKGVCYFPPCTAAQLDECRLQSPRTRCVVGPNGAVCSDPCASTAGTSGPVCPQTKPICTPSSDGQSAQCSGPCDDPQACPSGATCRPDATGSGKTCIFTDPCTSANNPCAQSAGKKCVSDNSVTPPTYTCQNACEPNPCTASGATCLQTMASPFYSCEAPTDPCRNYQCDPATPKCTVDSSSGTPVAKCVNPCAAPAGTTGPCANSNDGPSCKPSTTSPFYTCSNPCRDFQCPNTAPRCVLVEGQPTCQDPCNNNPCQTGTCSRQPTSPFFTCNVCEPNPCASGSTCRVDSSQPSGYSCIPTTTNPCSPNPCTTGTATVCTAEASQPNGYKCSSPDPCLNYQCPSTTPKCTVETTATGGPTAKCVDPCRPTTGANGPCASNSAGPVCKPASASPYYTCSDPCREFQCSADTPMCVIVEAQATCQNPCNRTSSSPPTSSSPCQTGQCRPKPTTPFYICATVCDPNPCSNGAQCRVEASQPNGYVCVSTTNPCASSPCTGTTNICSVDANSQLGYKCSAPANPCEPTPCRESPNTVCVRDTANAVGYRCVPPTTNDPCSPSPCTDTTRPICVKDPSTSAGFTCQPRPNPCANYPCTDTTKPMCVVTENTATGFTCQPRPDPCRDNPCKTNANQNYWCVPRQATGAATTTFECVNPCNANPCAAGSLCAVSATAEYFRTCTAPQTDPCLTMLCPATKPKCSSKQDPATGRWAAECLNICLVGDGNPCTSLNTSPAICLPDPANSRGYNCTSVVSCDTRPCPSDQICSMTGTSIVCTNPDPCAPTATGAPRCPNGNCQRADPSTSLNGANYICVNPCERVNCTVGTCSPVQVNGGWTTYCPPVGCGADCVKPRTCEVSTTGAYRCVTPPTVCSATTCPAGQECVQSSTGTSCVTPNPCSRCTSSQICVRDAAGNSQCKDDPCSRCSSSQRCNVNTVTGEATCTEDPCFKCQAAGSAGLKCGYDNSIKGYVCFDECVDSRCPTGTRCALSTVVNGKYECQAPPTCAQGAPCPAGQFCRNGACVVDPCANCDTANGYACSQTATGAWGCFYQPCATLRPCVAPDICRDADATTAGIRGYVCIKPDNRATPTIQVSLTITLNVSPDVIRSDTNFKDRFAQEIADLVKIAKGRVIVTGFVASSTGASTVVTFTILPANTASEGIQTSPTDVADRLNEKLEVAAATGAQVGNGQYTNAMATGAGAQQVQSAVYQCSNGQWVDNQSACPKSMTSSNLTSLAVGVAVGVVGALVLVGAVIYCKKNKAAASGTATEMV